MDCRCLNAAGDAWNVNVVVNSSLFQTALAFVFREVSSDRTVRLAKRSLQQSVKLRVLTRHTTTENHKPFPPRVFRRENDHEGWFLLFA